jgi:glutamyl/glutaminyl-tRNA synthetase
MLLWKKEPDPAQTRIHLTQAKELLSGLSEEGFVVEAIKNAVWPYAEANGKGNVLWPLRVALTGQEKSPDPFTSAYILGKKEALLRIGVAIAKLAD